MVMDYDIPTSEFTDQDYNTYNDMQQSLQVMLQSNPNIAGQGISQSSGFQPMTNYSRAGQTGN